MSSIWSRLINLSGGAVVGVLALSNGGTNKALTAVNGGLVWSDADSMEITAAGTASDWVLSGGAGTPTMSSTTTTAKMVDGSADVIQFIAQGHSTQTSDIFVAEKSDGTDLLEVTNVNGTKIRGTTTNDTAANGFVGEVVTAEVSVYANAATSTQFKDCTSVALTAGDWDISLFIVLKANGATVTEWEAGIGTSTGNSSTGLVDGTNATEGGIPTAAFIAHISVPEWPTQISGSTTYYAKVEATYSVATPQYRCRITARRVR